MIRLGTNKLKVDRSDAGGGYAPAREIVAEKGHVSTRRSGALARIVGNLLIVSGLLMLLGIGGWYGYTQWSNEQYKERLAARFGVSAVEPPAGLAPTPTTPTPAAPAPTFASALNNVGVGLLGALNKPPAQTDNSPPVRLSIKSVGIDSEVVPVSWDMIPAAGGRMKAEWQVADYAVGHHYGSANPGQIGNVVLSGHVDYKGQVFKELHKVNKGDEVTLYTEKGQYLYVVTDMVLVLEEGASEEQKRANARYMDPTPDQTLTMITCWPYGINTHRLIVIAKPYQSSLSTQSEFSIR